MTKMVELFKEFIDEIPTKVWAGFTAFAVAILRIAYDSVYGQQEATFWGTILEGVLCGVLAVLASFAIEAMGWDGRWIIFVSGFVGLCGVTSIRIWAKGFMDNRIGPRR